MAFVLSKFACYETASTLYVIGSDAVDEFHRILKVRRANFTEQISLIEDPTVYSASEISTLKSEIDDGNKNNGGLRFRKQVHGILGFIRFTGSWYMLVVTKKSTISNIGCHVIYQVDGTELIDIAYGAEDGPSNDTDRELREARYVTIFNHLDLTKSFYFSYTYDLTNSLQRNLGNIFLDEVRQNQCWHPPNDMFVWNQYLITPLVRDTAISAPWPLRLVHGSIRQKCSIDVLGRKIQVLLIARRSRHFAGARYLKRGINDQGFVANDVESEQIVIDLQTNIITSPSDLRIRPTYTAFVQHRGSIPVYWSQENNGVSPKPEIKINPVNPFYSSTALHFNNLFARYGAPVIILNLVKDKERTPRESKLLHEYTRAVDYLAQFLRNKDDLSYQAWDMSRAAKSADQDVVRTLQQYAKVMLQKVGIFHSWDSVLGTMKTQQGVIRSNCIDCLDRTNAAQFVIGRVALAHQLQALGIVQDYEIEFDSVMTQALMQLYQEHGDTIAVQYGGSHLVNTMDTYRKTAQFLAQSRDMVESFKRYMHNSFMDAERQNAINLFLGNFVASDKTPMLWDLHSDHYLHSIHPRALAGLLRGSYTDWPQTMDKLEQSTGPALFSNVEDEWKLHYKPHVLTTMAKQFTYKLDMEAHAGYHKTSNLNSRNPGEVFGPKHVSANITARSARGVGQSAFPTGIVDDIEGKADGGRLLSRANFGSTYGTDHSLNRTDSSITRKPRSDMSQWNLADFLRQFQDPGLVDDEVAEFQNFMDTDSWVPESTLQYSIPAFEHALTAQNVSHDSFNVLSAPRYERVLRIEEGEMRSNKFKAYRQWVKGKTLFKSFQQTELEPI